MNNLHEISKVFGDRLFQVPDYQRGYAWGEKQLKDFVEDLELLEPQKQHYFGTLVLQRHPEVGTIVDRSGRFYSTFDIIDGQQRLTTVALLMDAIRDAMRQQASLSYLAEGIQAVYLNVYDRSNQPLLRLKLNRDCDGYFRRAILGLGTDVDGPRIRSHELLRDAAKFFHDYLLDKSAETAMQHGLNRFL